MSDRFYSMSGEHVLTFIRDHLIETAVRRKNLAEESAKLSGGANPDVELGIKAMGAAADVFTLIIAEGKRRRADDQKIPRWIIHVCDQARAALVNWEEIEADGVASLEEFKRKKRLLV